MNGIPRDIAGWASYAAESADRTLTAAFNRWPITDPTVERFLDLGIVHGFMAAYALHVIERYCPPDIAERFAKDLHDAVEAGDSFGEWLYQWQREREAGETPTLPFARHESVD